MTWGDFLDQCVPSRVGSEHVVDFDDHLKLVGKTTKPPGFGLVPVISRLPHAVRPGAPAAPRDIEMFFSEAGWTRLKDPSGHMVFFNYAFQVMAIDAESRNCYLTSDGLQPFDVILCVPDEAIERFLGIYPE